MQVEPFANGLSWPIKRKFAAYIARLPDGRMTLEDGAAVSTGDTLLFPPLERSTFDTTTRRGTLRFGGVVQFSGHFGMLSVAVAAPWLEIDAETCILTIAATGGERRALATLVVSLQEGPRLVWRGNNVQLALASAALFGDVYSGGEPLDSLVASMPRTQLD